MTEPKARSRSKATEEATTPPAKEAPARYATLVRGRVYYYGTRLFERHKSQPVTEAEELYLEEHAVDEVTVEGENEHQPRQKFEFSDEPYDPEKAASKARRRR